MSPPGSSRNPIRVVLVGRPGSGKGTQGQRLAQRLEVPHIAAGDVLRQEVARGSTVGRQVAAAVASGCLVPDSLVVDALADRLATPDALSLGFVLDGFPRSVPQAITLERFISPARLTCALELRVAERDAAHRLLGRRRSDDQIAVIRQRFDEFERLTRPLLEWLDDRGLLRSVDGAAEPDVVADAVLRALGPLVEPIVRSSINA